MLAIIANDDHEDIRKSTRHKTALSCTRYDQDMTTFLEMTLRANLNHNIIKLVPKCLNIFMLNDNSGSLVHAVASGDSSIDFVALHHHASYFIK